MSLFMLLIKIWLGLSRHTSFSLRKVLKGKYHSLALYLILMIFVFFQAKGFAISFKSLCFL